MHFEAYLFIYGDLNIELLCSPVAVSFYTENRYIYLYTEIGAELILLNDLNTCLPKYIQGRIMPVTCVGHSDTIRIEIELATVVKLVGIYTLN